MPHGPWRHPHNRRESALTVSACKSVTIAHSVCVRIGCCTFTQKATPYSALIMPSSLVLAPCFLIHTVQGRRLSFVNDDVCIQRSDCQPHHLWAPPVVLVSLQGLYDGPCGTSANHAVLLVGYTDSTDKGPASWIVKNSWGPLWGELGYIRMKRNLQDTNAGICGIALYVSIVPE